MSRRAIRASFFLKKKFKKSNWEKKFGSFGPKFRRGFLTKFHQYKKNISRKKKDFSWENFFFLCFCFRAWRVNFCVFGAKIQAGRPSVPRKAKLENFFLDKKRKKRQLSDIFPHFLPKISSGVVKIAIEMSGRTFLGLTFFLQESVVFENLGTYRQSFSVENSKHVVQTAIYMSGKAIRRSFSSEN